MAITSAQRNEAVTLLIQSYTNPGQLAALVPGLTPAGLISAIVTAIGTQFDASLTTCLNGVVANYQAQLASTQASIAAINAAIATATVQ